MTPLGAHTSTCSTAAVSGDSKHALIKEAWDFLHSEGHINQGILQGEPAVQKTCECFIARLHLI